LDSSHQGDNATTSAKRRWSPDNIAKPWWAAPQVQISGRATSWRGEPGDAHNSPYWMTDHSIPGLHADWPRCAVSAPWEYATAAQGQSGTARVVKRSIEQRSGLINRYVMHGLGAFVSRTRTPPVTFTLKSNELVVHLVHLLTLYPSPRTSWDQTAATSSKGWMAAKFAAWVQAARLSCLEAALEGYHKLQPTSNTVLNLKDALQWTWTALSQKSIAKGVKDLCKRLEACVSANGGHFKHKMRSLTQQLLTNTFTV